ncbi:MAG TPA: matrixin family metalloprotease [Vicinamibacteria bacterium]|jgi:hypothetical protein
MIDSDLADMMSNDLRIREPLAAALSRPNVINLFFVKSLAGALGTSSGVYAAGTGRWPYAFIGDLGGLEPTPARWALEVVLIEHEFGHLLGLPHMPDPSNLMYASAEAGATTVVNTQLRIAQARGPRLPNL